MRKAEGDSKIYRHKAHGERLREIACREYNSEIRDLFSNEEKRGLPKKGKRKRR